MFASVSTSYKFSHYLKHIDDRWSGIQQKLCSKVSMQERWSQYIVTYTSIWGSQVDEIRTFFQFLAKRFLALCVHFANCKAADTSFRGQWFVNGNIKIMSEVWRLYGRIEGPPLVAILTVSPGRLKTACACHPDDIWLINVTHPDEVPTSAKSSG